MYFERKEYFSLYNHFTSDGKCKVTLEFIKIVITFYSPRFFVVYKNLLDIINMYISLLCLAITYIVATTIFFSKYDNMQSGILFQLKLDGSSISKAHDPLWFH